MEIIDFAVYCLILALFPASASIQQCKWGVIDSISISPLFLCLLCGLDHQIPVVYEILSVNLLRAYSNIKHTSSIRNTSSYPTRSILATEIIGCLQSLFPLKPLSGSQTFIAPVGRMDCPLLIVHCRDLSLYLLLLGGIYSKGIFHSSCSAVLPEKSSFKDEQ